MEKERCARKEFEGEEVYRGHFKPDIGNTDAVLLKSKDSTRQKQLAEVLA